MNFIIASERVDCDVNHNLWITRRFATITGCIDPFATSVKRKYSLEGFVKFKSLRDQAYKFIIIKIFELAQEFNRSAGSDQNIYRSNSFSSSKYTQRSMCLVKKSENCLNNRLYCPILNFKLKRRDSTVLICNDWGVRTFQKLEDDN